MNDSVETLIPAHRGESRVELTEIRGEVRESR